MAKKKLKDRKLGIFLKEKMPKVLDVVGNVLPDKGVLGIIKNLIDKDDSVLLSHEKVEFEQLYKHELDKIKPKTMKQVLTSKKFWYAVSGLIAIVVASKTDIAQEYISEVIFGIITIVTGLVVGQGLADIGKEAKKLEDD